MLLGVDALGCEVAIKTLPSSDPSLLESFIREVEIIEQLQHPNVVRVLDSSGLHDEVPWYAMEYVSGPTLKEIIQSEHAQTVLRAGEQLALRETGERQVRADWRNLLVLMTGIFDGLNAIHALGVVHRDVKPGNIVVRDDGTAVLIDFGISGILHGTIGREKLSDYLGGSGTPTYAPAEQLRGDTVDGRADIYALGCIMFELVTGQRPYRGESYYELLTAHRSAPIPSVRELNPEAPEALDQLITWTLAKRPDERPGFVVDVDVELRRVLGLEPPTYTPAQYVYHPAFIGRQSEYRALKQFVRATAQRASHLAVVTGPAGIGKTRLLQELLVEADSRVQMVHVSAIGDEPTIVRMWERLRLGRKTALPEFPSWDGPENPVPAMISVLQEATALMPVVVMFDDAAELDPTTLRLLSAICMGPIPGASVIMVFRSDEDLGPVDELPVDLRVDLGPLSSEELGQVVASMLALPQLAAQPQDLLMRQCNGNPFVAAEYVRWAIDEEMLVRAGGRWELLNDRPLDFLGDLPVPKRLGNMVFSRFARLESHERDFLTALAICGDDSEFAFVQAVAGTRLGQDELLCRKIIEARDGKLRFSQPAWAQVVRRATVSGQGRMLHERAAQWLIARGATTPALANHLEACDKTLEAARAFQAVARQAWRDMRYHEAAQSYLRSLEALPPTTQAQWDALEEYRYADFDVAMRGPIGLFSRLAEIAHAQGRRDLEAIWIAKDQTVRLSGPLPERFIHARELAESSGDVDAQVWVLATILLEAPELDLGEVFGRLTEVLDECTNLNLLYFGRHSLAMNLSDRQRYQDAVAYVENDPPPSVSAWVMFRHVFGYALVLGDLGEHEQSLALFASSAELARSIGHARLQLTSQWNVVNQLQHLGRYDEAAEILEALVVQARVLPFDRLRIATFLAAGTNASALGHARRADRYFSRARQVGRTRSELAISVLRAEGTHARRYGQLARARQILSHLTCEAAYDRCSVESQLAMLAMAVGESPDGHLAAAREALEGFGPLPSRFAATLVERAEFARTLPPDALWYGEPRDAVPPGILRSFELATTPEGGEH